MSKELKILKEIEAIHLSDNVSVGDVADDEIKVLKQALKRNAELEKGIRTLEKKCNRYQRKLKAFEIIKEKKVNIWTLSNVGLDRYNAEFTFAENRKLTQQEYDLFKEVLL